MLVNFYFRLIKVKKISYITLINRTSFRMNCHYVHLRCDKSAVKKFFTEQKASFTEQFSVTNWEIDDRLFN